MPNASDVLELGSAQARFALSGFLSENGALVAAVGLDSSKAIFQGEVFPSIPLPPLSDGATMAEIAAHAKIVERRSAVANLIARASEADAEKTRRLQAEAKVKAGILAEKVLGIAGEVGAKLALGALAGTL